MEQIEKTYDWLQQHFIQYNVVSKNVVEIDGDNYLIVSEKNNKIFTNNMSLMLSESELNDIEDYNISYFIIYFGDRCYYLNDKDFEFTDIVDEVGDVVGQSMQLKSMKELKYIGQYINKDQQIVFPMLGVHGGYDLCNGSKMYNQWCEKAKWLGIEILGICEENTLAGALLFQNACQKAQLRSVIGETICVEYDSSTQYHIKLYVLNQQGWINLCQINGIINTSKSKSIKIQQLQKFTDGLICVLTATISISAIYQTFGNMFDNIFYQLDFVKWKNSTKDEEWLDNLYEYLLSYRDKIQPIAIYDCYYLEQQDNEIQPILWQIGKRENFKYRSDDRWFKTSDEYINQALSLFDESDDKPMEIITQAIENTLLFNDIEFSIPTGQKHLPVYELTAEQQQQYQTSENLFYSLIEQGIEQKVKQKGLDVDKYIERVQQEVETIEYGQVRDYFLIVWDILNWCRDNNILFGIGRGSAAGCLVSYLLNIVQIDPLQYDLIFERFLNKGRVGKSMPDIDNDIMGSRRDEVKRYIEQRYGKDFVAGIGTYGTFKIRAALKDIVREMGGDQAETNYISAIIDPEDNYIDIFAKYINDKTNPRLYQYVKKHSRQISKLPCLLHQPKTQSVHAAGVVIVPKDNGTIYQQLPCKTMDDIVITEWEGEQIEQSGFLKIDILGIRQLDKFDDILKLIKQHYNVDLNLNEIPLDDKQVYQLFSQGFNEDIFQFGGQGLKEYCKVLKPDNIEDLIATVALYRPGPIEMGAHERYAKIKNGNGIATYPFGTENILKNTYGLICYQEQTMKIVQELAGFSLVEADDIRKAMGKKIAELMAKYKQQFIDGAVNSGCPQDEAEQIWKDLEGFASYAFNRCISGQERIYRASQNKSGKSAFYPTVAQMFKIKNNYDYAKSIGKTSLHWKYKNQGYPHSFSLNEQGKLIKNKIKNISFAGFKEVYTVTTQSGKTIDVTLNHKFPTNNGEKQLKDIDIENDLLFINENDFSTCLEKIVSIEFKQVEDVYDVEMEHPYHTFVNIQGVVTSNSHAACYAITGYYCQWLKCNFPLEFWLTSLKYSRDDEVQARIAEIKNITEGIKIQQPDILKSRQDYYGDVDTKTIYWSLNSVKYVSRNTTDEIADFRQKHSFVDLESFVKELEIYKQNKKIAAQNEQIRVYNGINKRVICYLIVAGAFDNIERIKKPNERRLILKKYFQLINPELQDDVLMLNSEQWQSKVGDYFQLLNCTNDYTWTLKQKEVCGFGNVDFQQVVEQLDYNNIGLFISNSELNVLDLQSKKKKVIVGGIVTEVKNRNSKNGPFCQLVIHDGLAECKVTVWNESYEKYIEQLQDCVGKLFFIDGDALYDSGYMKCNVIHSKTDSKLNFLQ